MARTRRAKDVPTTVRKDGRLVAVVGWTDDLDRVKRTYVYGKTQAEVNEKHAVIMKRLGDGFGATDANKKLDSFATGWITSTLSASDRKSNTKTLYAGITRKHIVGSELGAMTLKGIKPRHVEAWIKGLRAKGLASSSVRQIYTVLRAILDTAVRDEDLSRNPVVAVDRPKVDRHEAEYLTTDQVRLLLESAKDSRYAPLFALLVNTGLRRGEALALRWADVSDDAIRVRGTLSRVDGLLAVTTTKTPKSNRTIPLSTTTSELLSGLKHRQRLEKIRAGSQWATTGYVFTTELGEPCDPRNALRAFKAAAKRAKLEGIGLHTLRHSAASVMLVNGVPLKVVSEILGHSSIAITGDIYGHVSPEVSRDALDTLATALGA